MRMRLRTLLFFFSKIQSALLPWANAPERCWTPILRGAGRLNIGEGCSKISRAADGRMLRLNCLSQWGDQLLRHGIELSHQLQQVRRMAPIMELRSRFALTVALAAEIV